MLKGKLVFICVMMISVIALVSCSNKTTNNIDDKEYITINESQKTTVYEYGISSKKLNREKICNYFLPDYDVNNMPEEQANGFTFVDSGDKTLAMGKGRIQYSINDDADVKSEIMFYYLFPDLLELGYDTKSDITDVEKDEDIKKIKQEIEDLILESDDEKIKLNRALKIEKKELQDIIKKIEKVEEDIYEIEDWEGNEYIALEYEIEKNNILMMGIEEPAQGYEVDVIGAQPTYIQVLVANGEILNLEASGLVSVDNYEEVIILSKEEALNIASREYEDVLTNETRELLNVKLEYVVIPDWTEETSQPNRMIPYWCIINTINGDEKYEDAIRINAINGGNLSYGE